MPPNFRTSRLGSLIGNRPDRFFPIFRMPDPDRLLVTLGKAAATWKGNPGRRGSVVDLRNALEVLVCGDLHGNLENFRLLLKRADLANAPQRHLVLQEVIHSSFCYPAGGDKSHQLLDL